MTELLDYVPVLFAQQDGGGGSSFWTTFLFMAPLFFGAYFLILRPQQQQEKKRRALLEALKKNDKVITTAGMFGTVVSLDDKQERLVLRIDDEKGVKVTLLRSSVHRIVEPSEKDKGGDAS
jgi:preprotein translocase subunit YajC